MGSIVPIALQAVTAFQTIGAVASVFDNSQQEAEDRLALQQLQQRQALDQAHESQQAVIDRQEIQTKAAEAERQRKAALKRAVARQRAEFGAGGIGSSGGSSEAVLLGMFDESEEEKMNRERLDGIRTQAIDQNLSQAKRVNTLKRTQEAEKRKLQRSTSSLDTFNDLLSVF